MSIASAATNRRLIVDPPDCSASNHSTLFAGVDPRALAVIVKAAQSISASPRDVIIEEGGKTEHLYLVKAGRVRFYRLTPEGQEVVLGWLIPGDSFGLGTLLEHPRPYIGTAEALTQCDLLVWDRRSIRRLAANYPCLAENALNIVLRYLERGVEHHVGLIAKSAEERIEMALFNLVERVPLALPNGFQVDITNEQLSSLAAVSPFTASRVLRKLEREGTISKERGRIIIHSPAKLLFH